VVHLKADASMGDGTRVELRAGAFEFGADEPESVGGTGTAPNPVQLSLAALGSCQAITYRYWAEQLGVQLDAVTVTVDADFDTGAFFGFPGSSGVPSPMAVRCAVTLEGPEPAERYKDLAVTVDEHCPVLDLFTRSIPVERVVTTP
jgi:uncharacterized OsmC-like protein